jgi:hypothetical protein
MSVLIGVHPGGRMKFAVCALFWSGKLPVSVFRARSYSGVDDVLADIVGVQGEWGSLAGIAIDAPLTWSGAPSGWRACDLALRNGLPSWVPKTWIRPPTTIPGAISVQGPALGWALAQEIKNGQLPEHGLVETNPRLSLACIASDLRDAVLGYRSRDISDDEVAAHIKRLVGRLEETGIIRIDAEPPSTPDELDALACAVVALARAYPDSGLLLGEWQGGDIRPIGRRPVAILRGLP